MSLYVMRVTLEVNGVSFSDFDGFTDKSVTKAKQVNLMNKTGTALMQERFGFEVSTKVPVEGWSIDMANVRGGTTTVEWEGGKRTTYSGVYTLEDGDSSTDGETELGRTIIFGAEKKIEEN